MAPEGTQERKDGHLSPSILLELALASGTSLGIYENCEQFFSKFQHLLGVHAISLWVEKEELTNCGCSEYTLLHTHPFNIGSEVSGIRTGHPLWNMLQSGKPHFSLLATDPLLQKDTSSTQTASGAYAFLIIKNFGFLKIYDAKRQTVFPNAFMDSIQAVFLKFAEGVKLSIMHQHIIEERNELYIKEKKQWEANARYKQIVDNINEGIVITDLEGRIIFSNEQMSALTGYSADEMTGKISYQLFGAPSEQSLVKYRLAERKRGISEVYELEQVRKDGTRWWAKVVAAPFVDENGNITGTVGLTNNITSSKESEQRREAMLQHLDTAYRESKSLSKTIVQEIKDPLRAISTIADWVIEDYADKLGKEGSRQLLMVKERADSLNEFIEKLLDFSTLELSMSPFMPTNLNDLVPQPANSKEDLGLVTKVSCKKVLPTLNCDGKRIRQLFQEALQFMAKQGEEVEIDWEEDADFYFVFFKSINTLITHAHKRDDATEAHRTIGISLAKRIAELHGGSFFIKKLPEKQFTIVFSLKKN